MNISDKIKAIREAKRIKQSEVAIALDLDSANYSRLEKRGDKLTVEQLKKIADALGVHLGDLLEIDSPFVAIDSERIDYLNNRVSELQDRLKDKIEKEDLINKRNELIREKIDAEIYVFFALIGFTYNLFEQLTNEAANIKEKEHIAKYGGGNFETFIRNDYTTDISHFMSFENLNKVKNVIFGIPLIGTLIELDLVENDTKNIWRKWAELNPNHKEYGTYFSEIDNLNKNLPTKIFNFFKNRFKF